MKCFADCEFVKWTLHARIVLAWFILNLLDVWQQVHANVSCHSSWGFSLLLTILIPADCRWCLKKTLKLFDWSYVSFCVHIDVNPGKGWGFDLKTFFWVKIQCPTPGTSYFVQKGTNSPPLQLKLKEKLFLILVPSKCLLSFCLAGKRLKTL